MMSDLGRLTKKWLERLNSRKRSACLRLFPSRTGRTSWRWLPVSVKADNTMVLSAAVTLMKEEATAPVVRNLGLKAHSFARITPGWCNMLNLSSLRAIGIAS
jgi:anti-sigma-K factor RskA